jgi:hypothetical protein
MSLAMNAVELQQSLQRDVGLKSITWLKNPSDVVLEAFIEPWGSTIFLLPKTEYAVVTEGKSEDPHSGATVELGDPVTVWPEGNKSNRIYRADGGVVWDDADPSDVYPLADDMIAAARYTVDRDPGLTIDIFATVPSVAPFVSKRSDLAMLLVEHGLLTINDRGLLRVPGRKKHG